MKLNEINSLKLYGFSCIYIWININNNKRYVGQTRNFYNRMKQYQSGHFNKYMKHAIEKHGIECFNIEILERDLDYDKLDTREQYWIDHYESYKSDKGYNIARYASNTFGYIHTKETIEKMKKIAKKRFSDPKEREMLSGKNNPMYGTKHTNEWRLNHSKCVKNLWENKEYREIQTKRMMGKNNPMYGIRMYGEKNGMYGKHHSQETKSKIIRALTGRKSNVIVNNKRVICVETGVIYNSQSDASREYNVTQSAISNACLGKSKTCQKKHWKFYD